MTQGCAAALDGERPSALAVGSARLLRALERGLGFACVLILACLLGLVLTTVVARYVFGAGILGADELAIWLHVALVAFGAPLALNSALAMRLDVFTRLLSPRGQWAASAIAEAFAVLSGLVMLFGGGAIVLQLGGTSPTLGLPEWTRFALLGLGGGLVVLVTVLRHVAIERAAPLAASLALGIGVYILANELRVPVDLPPSMVLGMVVVVGLIAGAPLPHAFLAGAYVAIPFGSTMPEPAMVAATVAGMSKFLLLAIPFFLLAGGLLTASGVAGHLVRFAASLVGHRRAGLAQTTLLTGVLFSGASGSSVANAAFGAATFQPELVRHGYRPERAGAIIAATSVLDNVIPPSIAFLILAAATNLSVGSLLVGGFVAGAVMAIALAVAIHLTVEQTSAVAQASRSDRAKAARAAIPAFGLGAIVVLGIRFGVVTTTEAAALAALYGLVLAACNGLSVRSTYRAFRQAGIEAAAIGMLIGTAAPFAFLLAVDDIAGSVSGFVHAFGGGPLGVLAIANVILLAAGLVLDIGAAILLFGPILLPAVTAAGIDQIHFGVILVVNLMIGGLTPPVGMLVYVVSGVIRVPAATLFRAILPYLAALLAALALLSAGAVLTAGGLS